MNDRSRFSERHGFRPADEAEITVRHDAPYELRGVLVDLAYECGFFPSSLRSLVCSVFRKRPDSSNWSEYPNINQEVRSLLDNCNWYEVYDLIEALVQKMHEVPALCDPVCFQTELNRYFLEEGIGWRLHDGKLEARNPVPLEETLRSAATALAESGTPTAQEELKEALADISRRPSPDITGSVQHAMAALECVAREVTGLRKATLGEILKRSPGLVPPPMDVALDKLWGFASEYGRHIREGRNPDYHEAQLVVGTCAAVVTYLIGKRNI